MGFRDFDRTEIESVLAQERIIRIAFHQGDDFFLVPVFYVWHEGSLCGLTTPGRKTLMGAANPLVAFQIDSAMTTGPYAWSSVIGQGAWEVVDSPAEFGPFAVAMRTKLSDAPAWAQTMLTERFAALGMVAWRIKPLEMSGRAHEQ